MSGTSLETHQIQVIQKKYYQNSLLHVSRQEVVNKPSGATSRRKRRRSKKKNEQGNSVDEVSESQGNKVNEANEGNEGNENEKRKVSKRSVHWHALRDETEEMKEELKETVKENNEMNEKKSDDEEECKTDHDSLFGWLRSFFRS